jgi:murein DD-endopeptidase MepM/ murein hydrolase activator NlpD
MFVKMLLDQMPEESEGAVSGGFGGGVWRDMLHQEYATSAAKTTGFGIADSIMRQFKVQMGGEQPVLPVNGARVSSRFGMRDDPLQGDHRHHGGVDFAAPLGTPVHAVLGATVLRAGPAGGYGNMVELRHRDGTITRYAHLDTLAVSAGQLLRRGDTVGTVGSTGRSTGAHLHFEVLRDGHAHNPNELLGRVQSPGARR